MIKIKWGMIIAFWIENKLIIRNENECTLECIIQNSQKDVMSSKVFLKMLKYKYYKDSQIEKKKH